MAKRPEKKRPSPSAPLARIRRLPRVAGECWQADICLMPAWSKIAGQWKRPWVLMVTDSTRDLVLASDLRETDPTADQLLEVLMEAFQNPLAGTPHRPGVVQVRSPSVRDVISDALSAADIVCQADERLEHLDSVLQNLAQHLQGSRKVPALIDVPGVDDARLARFYRAAASFYRREPWLHFPGDMPIELTSNQTQSGPWYAVIMGQSGMTYGMALYESGRELREMMETDHAMSQASALSLMFGPQHEIAIQDLDRCNAQRWEVAGDKAYPFTIRLNPGRSVRTPLAWELDLVEASLWALPDFVELGAADARIRIPALSEGTELRLKTVEV